MLRVSCATEPVDREPLIKDMLAFSAELDKNLDDYLEKFNPNVFNAIYLDENRFVNPRNHQKRLYINSNPTFRYLELNVPAHLLCPRYPAPHIPVIWSKLVKGQYNAIFTGLDYVIEFPNHFHSGLLKCSFVDGRKKYEHTFILSFQNRQAETFGPQQKCTQLKAPSVLPPPNPPTLPLHC